MRLNKNRAKTALTHLGNGKMTSLMYGLAWLKDLPNFPRNSYCIGNVKSRVDCGSASPGVDSCCNHIDHVLSSIMEDVIHIGIGIDTSSLPAKTICNNFCQYAAIIIVMIGIDTSPHFHTHHLYNYPDST